MASQDARLPKFEADFKQQQSEMTNKIDTVLKDTNRIAGTLPSDTVNNPKLGTHPISSARSYPTIYPQRSFQPSNSINAIKAHFKEATISQISLQQPKIKTEPPQPKEPEPTLEDEFQDCILTYRLRDSKPFDTLADLGSCVNIIPLYLFKNLNIGLLEETDHIFGLANRTKAYPVRIVKDVEVHIGKLKLLNDFYVIDTKKDPEFPLLVRRGFLATTNAIIDCRMAKIEMGKGVTRSIFRVKGVDLDEKDFLDCHLPGEWKIARDAELNPFKDTLVFKRMVKFLGAIPINLKSNIWGSDDLIKKPMNWDKPPKNEDGAWHAKIRLIDPDGEEFTKTIQSFPTTRKLFERESPREIIDFDHLYDT
ncbi:MAK10-like protein [Tanacetum coccineum]